MRKYEVLLILPAESDDKAVGEVSERITKVLSSKGGEVTKSDRWGRRRFAFEIDKQTEGFYLLLEFQAEPETLTELDRVLSLADQVIRFKVTTAAA
jgi:small subunit ribosomal protein S6